MSRKKKLHHDRTVSRAAPAEKPVNPFDIHYNKVKRNAVGRKLMRCEQGRPNRARHEAVEKRKKTLLQEYLRKDRTGKFRDKRIGEEKGGIAARKAKIFDLKMKGIDQSELTHQGKSLTSENLLSDRPENDDFEDDVDLNLLRRADYVEAAHFGGGDDDQLTQDGVRKSQSEYLDEVMNEKRRRQYEQEMNWSLTEKLDDEWKDVRSLLTTQKPPQNTTTNRASGHDQKVTGEDEPQVVKDYDVVMREMMFAGKSLKSKVGNATVTGERERSDPIQKPRIRRQSQNSFESEEKRLKVIQRVKDSNVVILPLFEPRLEEPAMKKDPLKKLQKQVKREFRGAQRELKKDTAFLKEVWMKEITEKDETRKKKVNKIIADLASDIHDVRSIKKGS